MSVMPKRSTRYRCEDHNSGLNVQNAKWEVHVRRRAVKLYLDNYQRASNGACIPARTLISWEPDGCGAWKQALHRLLPDAMVLSPTRYMVLLIHPSLG